MSTGFKNGKGKILRGFGDDHAVVKDLATEKEASAQKFSDDAQISREDPNAQEQDITTENMTKQISRGESQQASQKAQLSDLVDEKGEMLEKTLIRDVQEDPSQESLPSEETKSVINEIPPWRRPIETNGISLERGTDKDLSDNNTQSSPFSKIKQLNNSVEEMSTKELLRVTGKGIRFIKKMGIITFHTLFDNVKIKNIIRHFEKGTLIESTDFRFLRYNNSLMVFRYLGTSKVMRVPAYVGKLPVIYLHPDLLFKNVLDNYKFRAIKNSFNWDSSNGAEAIGQARGGVTEVILPNTLKMIPSGVFSGCYSLKTLVIPSSLTCVMQGAFENCSLTTLYLNGACPDGLLTCTFDRDMSFQFRSELQDTFYHLIKQTRTE